MKFSIARQENVTFKYKWVQGQVRLCSDEVYLIQHYVIKFVNDFLIINNEILDNNNIQSNLYNPPLQLNFKIQILIYTVNNEYIRVESI